MKFSENYLLSATRKIIIFCGIFAVFLVSGNAHAARFFIQPSILDLSKTNEVGLYFDAEGREVNALEAKFKFDKNLFLVTGLSDANSIISLWAEKPAFSNNTGEITFSGITPGGFSGNAELVLKFVVSASTDLRGSLSLSGARAILNTGTGVEVPVSAGNLSFSMINSSSKLAYGTDANPPEIFKPELVSNPDIFDGKWALVFATADKGSGLDHFEILEVQRGGNLSGNWEIAVSPYLLADQSLSSDIYVRAVDRTGNFVVVKVPAKNAPPFLPVNYSYAIAFAVLLLLLVVGYTRRRRNKNGTPKIY